MNKSGDEHGPPDSSAEPISREPIFVITDQVAHTGIGVYASSLYHLLSSAFPGMRVVSLNPLVGEAFPDSFALSALRKVSSRWLIPLVREANEQLLRSTLPRDARAHLCGVSYRLSSYFDSSVSTIHDFYPRVPSIGNLARPKVIGRDLASLLIYIRIPREVQRCKSIIVPTREVQSSLMSRASIRSQVIHHWIETSRFHPRIKNDSRIRLGLPDPRTLLLSVGGGTSNKNLGLLEQIARLLPQGFTLVKVGEPLAVPPPRVLNLHRLNRELYPLVFNACDVYVHTSSVEGFGRPLIEALGSRLPILARRTLVTEELLGDSAILLEPTATARDWVGSVRTLENPGTRREILDRAEIQARLFSEERARDLYTELYIDAFGL